MPPSPRHAPSPPHGQLLERLTGSGLRDGLSLQQAEALLFLIKLEYVFEGSWLPLFEIYTGLLASRYLTRLKASMLQREYLIPGADAGARR
jgi:hypothetical protein